MTSIIYADIDVRLPILRYVTFRKRRKTAEEDDEIQTIELKQPEAMWILKQSERRTDGLSFLRCRAVQQGCWRAKGIISRIF